MDDRHGGLEGRRREQPGVAEPVGGPRCVIVGWDGSASSARALAFAAGLAQRSAERLLAVRVCPAVPSSDWYGVAAAALAGTERSNDTPLPDDAARVLDDRLPRRWRSVTVYGDIATTLVSAAKEARADTIVVGQGDHPGRHLFGTVAQKLVRRAPCPVIVVP
jgi:nucleotide-binding universal stress UspA family protein